MGKSCCRKQNKTDDVEIELKKVTGFEEWQPPHHGKITEPVEVQITLLAEDPHVALQEADQLLEDICDNLAFRLQMPIPIRQLEVIDVSEPLKIGEERDFLLFPYPNGYQHSKFENVQFINSTITEMKPELEVDFHGLDEKDRRILNWYHKALSATSIMDKFLFLFICAEILCNASKIKVLKPYVPSCEHEIENCPTCGKSTEKKVFGPTLKKYLEDVLGLNKDIAKDIWKVRQIVHGEKNVNVSLLKRISDICLSLQSGVTSGIRQRLNVPLDTPPFVNNQGVGISNTTILGGKRAIDESDL